MPYTDCAYNKIQGRNCTRIGNWFEEGCLEKATGYGRNIIYAPNHLITSEQNNEEKDVNKIHCIKTAERLGFVASGNNSKELTCESKYVTAKIPPLRKKQIDQLNEELKNELTRK